MRFRGVQGYRVVNSAFAMELRGKGVMGGKCIGAFSGIERGDVKIFGPGFLESGGCFNVLLVTHVRGELL